jgi:hypothetical protein
MNCSGSLSNKARAKPQGRLIELRFTACLFIGTLAASPS